MVGFGKNNVGIDKKSLPSNNNADKCDDSFQTRAMSFLTTVDIFILMETVSKGS